ncbi:MAG: MBL fold metallo-hydrolase [Gemmatimonadetes bacterium]|nr:MBL fold metallo-hydrolase [Gemmatimonadota bacterium]MCC7134618.1 MBL fold metallo-hydrolase [Gemmatimonadales bacterium]
MAPLRIVTIPNGQFQENCYLLAEAGSTDAVIVDPGEEPELFLATAEREGLQIREIWLTHAHLDHVVGVADIKAATGAPIFLHPADEPLYRNLPQQGLWFGLRLSAPPPVDRQLSHGGSLTLGSTVFQVRHTPGHSAGSVCFITDGIVIGGDVLFQGSIGRTDLPGGNFERLIQSIRDELLPLPDATVVYSGHGPATTVGAERRGNPFLVEA